MGWIMIPVLHSVSYAGYWGQETLTLEEFIPHAAKLGYQGVMLTSKMPHLSPLTYDHDGVKKLKGLLDQHNIAASCIAGYSDPNAGFTATSGPFAPLGETQLIAIKHWCEMAQQLDCKILRLMTGLANTGEAYLTQWKRCVQFLRDASDVAQDFGITVGVQNHDDIGGHYLSMADLVDEIDRPNAKACFDAWSVALQDEDVTTAANHLGDRIIHTTVADYVKRPRFQYHHPGEGNVYERKLDEVKACLPGEGFIDYTSFFNTLRDNGFKGTVAFEMCSPIFGGGSRRNLDHYAQSFLKFFEPWV